MKISRPAWIWSTSKGTNMVVIGTAELVAIVKLTPGEKIPDRAVTKLILRSKKYFLKIAERKLSCKHSFTDEL